MAKILELSIRKQRQTFKGSKFGNFWVFRKKGQAPKLSVSSVQGIIDN